MFLLAKAAAERPRTGLPARRRGLVAATAMGGSFADRPARADFFPGHGGIAGLVKTLAREWAGRPRPGRRPRPSRARPTSLAARLAAEVLADDGWSEVGYPRRRRIRLQGRGSPARDRRATPKLELAQRRAGDRDRRGAGDHGDRRRRAGPALAADPAPARAGARCPPSAEDRETLGIDVPVRAEGGAPRPAPPRRASGLARPTSSGPIRLSPRPARSAANLRGLPVEPGRPSNTRRSTSATPGPSARVLDGWRRQVRRPGGPDPRRGGDPGQADPRQDARVVRPRPRHEARRRPEPGQAARSPSRSGSRRSSRRSPAGSATSGSPTTRRPTRSSTSWRSGSTAAGRAGSSR